MSVQAVSRAASSAASRVAMQQVPSLQVWNRLSDDELQRQQEMRSREVFELNFFAPQPRRADQSAEAAASSNELPAPAPSAKEETLSAAAPAQEEQQGRMNFFEGLPLRAWAESLGERFMPMYEAIQEDQKRNSASGAVPVPKVSVPRIPHLLPFTRWAAQSDGFKETFVVENAKELPRPRLSWYHPDDTMVPRGWWKHGLLEDLAYYRPFATTTDKET